MSRREYTDPPVHEVILDLRFRDSLHQEALRQLPEKLSERFGDPSPFNVVELRAGFSSAGAQSFGRDTSFGGWVFQEEEPRWVLRLLQNRITLHSARPGDWPKGKYVGWEEIFQRYTEVHDLVGSVYGELSPKRVGLDYQNRIAIPIESDLEEWFTLFLNAPDLFGDLYSLDLKQTWANLKGYDDLSATVKLARITIDDPEISEGHVGMLLDIDVFNLLVEDAPAYDDVPAWYKKAHKAENEIFEGCITARLRETFEKEEG